MNDGDLTGVTGVSSVACAKRVHSHAHNAALGTYVCTSYILPCTYFIGHATLTVDRSTCLCPLSAWRFLIDQPRKGLQVLQAHYQLPAAWIPWTGQRHASSACTLLSQASAKFISLVILPSLKNYLKVAFKISKQNFRNPHLQKKKLLHPSFFFKIFISFFELTKNIQILPNFVQFLNNFGPKSVHPDGNTLTDMLNLTRRYCIFYYKFCYTSHSKYLEVSEFFFGIYKYFFKHRKFLLVHIYSYIFPPSKKIKSWVRISTHVSQI